MRLPRTGLRFAMTSALTLAMPVAAARAQPPIIDQSRSSANGGALTMTAGIDVPSVYVFRGFVQESDPALTLTPYGDLGITLVRGATVPRLRAHIGVWNSLQSGSSGTKGPSGRLHYAENFYSSVSLGLASRILITPAFTAYTSPNAMFNTITEASVTAAYMNRFRPYALLASELRDSGQADGGAHKGTYAEFGATPSQAIGRRVVVSLPARVGSSVKDYYELAGIDHGFGFAEVGGHVLLHLPVPAEFGAWAVHGGTDMYVLGVTPKAFNRDSRTKVVASIGVAVAY